MFFGKEFLHQKLEENLWERCFRHGDEQKKGCQKTGAEDRFERGACALLSN